MITQFDKSGTVAHYKKKFSECIDDGDFEGALDYLLKYRDERHNDDFHMTCGMLYLQLSIDSDDNELVTLAYREFMMYLAYHPDCENAYRNILASLLLRRDGRAFVVWCKFIKDRGLDFERIVGELADCGALFIASNTEPPDFDMLFDGEYGEIESSEQPPREPEPVAAPSEKKKSKIIEFAEKPNAEYAERVKAVVASERAEFDARIDDMFSADSDGVGERENTEKDYVGDFDDLINAYIYGESYDEEDEDAVLDAAGLFTPFVDGNDGGIDVNIKKAEEAFENNEYDKALELIQKVDKNKDCYHFSLVMRANMLMICGRYDEAQSVLDESMTILPHSALGGSLLCRLYELQGKTELIPQALLNIDVCDYINYTHLFKSFDMAIKYCDEKTAAKLLRDYIDEFNIMEMRVVYAQLMYNLGERDFAIDELYSISRVFYDDINAQIMYRAAKNGVKKFALTAEAPQETLAVVVDGLMTTVISGYADAVLSDDDLMLKSVEFFLTLEFRSGNRLLSKMFETVRLLARSEAGETHMREAMVSPYIEPIVKGVILGELLCRDPQKPFFVDLAYLPVSSEDVPTLGAGLSDGFYIAYAFVLLLDRRHIDDFVQRANNTDFAISCDAPESAKALYLLRAHFGKKSEDQRLPFALGYASKAAATRAYKAICRDVIE